MNMKFNGFNFVEVIMNLFAAWLSNGRKEWAWCPVKVSSQDDRF